jgi:hypothetical protein
MAACRPSTPIEKKATSVPLNYSLWVDKLNPFQRLRTNVIEPTPDEPISRSDTRTKLSPTLKYGKLMAKGDYFKLQ